MNTLATYLGIFMDHASAHLIEFATANNETKTIVSDFTHDEKLQSLSKSENLMHHKEQHQQAQYYKKIGEKIRNYNHVLLFGPTNAKSELMNLLKSDHNFEKIHITLKDSDKLSETQQHIFVKDYFSKQL